MRLGSAMIWLLFEVILLFSGIVSSQYAAVTWNPISKQYQIFDHEVANTVAEAVFTDDIFKTGWAYLQVKSSGLFPDTVKAYAAGLVEGYLTRDLISKHWQNTVAFYCLKDEELCSELKPILDDNLQFMNDEISTKRSSDPYFHNLALILEQLSGLEDGYLDVKGQPRTWVNSTGLLLMNAMYEINELTNILNRTNTDFFGHGSCSALIKVLPNNDDIYFAHDAWADYNTMLRILKKYNLNLHVGMFEDSPVIPGRSVTFSSYPGILASLDDFYLLSSGLAIMETTNVNYNSELWQHIKPDSVILEWIRNLIANRLASSGYQWTELFSLLNSGTYNNQWMILDYTLFNPGHPLPDNLLWVSEQLPGHMHNEDLTHVLRDQGYWPSYNVPYFEDTFKLSGGPDMVQKYGNYFSHDKAPRALIFKREQGQIDSVEKLMTLMRFNNYTNDPLSRCECTPPYSAINTIASRCELNPENGTYPFPALGHRPHGSIDMKLTTFYMFQHLEFMAISGPTHDPLPVFQWSTSTYDETLSHVGQPDVWDFAPVVHEWL